MAVRALRLLVAATLGLACGCGAFERPVTALDPTSSPSVVVQADVEDVLPVEDLMREHGVLRRILLVYRECLRRLDAQENLPPAIVTEAADIVRRFIEDYHERLEEEYLFPAFRKEGKLVSLVDTLYAQHQAGRSLTARIQREAKASSWKPLREDLAQFIRMYEPHAAREDTVLFPAFRSVVTPQTYAQYGDLFEDIEHERFGPRGFESMVDRVADLERQLGLYDLTQFTPKVD